MTIWQFVKKHFLLVFILALIPLIAFLTFAIREYALHQIDMKAGEWAAFIGAILSYIGTVLLGLLALWQNEVIKYNSDEYNKKIFDLQMISNVPSFECKAVGCNGRFMNLVIKLTNTFNIFTDKMKGKSTSKEILVRKKTIKMAVNPPEK